MVDPGLFRADRCPQSLLLGFIHPFTWRDRQDDPVSSRAFDYIGHHAAELHFRPASQYRCWRYSDSDLYLEIVAAARTGDRKIYIHVRSKNTILVNRNRRRNLFCHINSFS